MELLYYPTGLHEDGKQTAPTGGQLIPSLPGLNVFRMLGGRGSCLILSPYFKTKIYIGRIKSHPFIVSFSACVNLAVIDFYWFAGLGS